MTRTLLELMGAELPLGLVRPHPGSTHPGRYRCSRASSVAEAPQRLAHDGGPAGDHLLHPGETPPEHRVTCHGADAWTCSQKMD